MTRPKQRKEESAEDYSIRLERHYEKARLIGRASKDRRRRSVVLSVEDLPGEVWKPVVGYEGFYEVSDAGRVKGVTREVPRLGFARRVIGKLLRAHHHVGGYLIVDLRRGNKRVTCYVHRLVLEAFVGPCPPGMQCRHLNGIRDDARLANLAWGTPSENAADKLAHGTQPLGESSPVSIFSEREVRAIRALAANGVTMKVIGLAFDTPPSTIGQIVSRRSWKHI